MGLDCFLYKTAPDSGLPWRITDQLARIPIMRGCVVGWTERSFRGGGFVDKVHTLTGYSLYDQMSSKQVKDMYSQLKEKLAQERITEFDYQNPANEFLFSNASRYSQPEWDNNAQWSYLLAFLHVAADNDLSMVAWS